MKMGILLCLPKESKHNAWGRDWYFFGNEQDILRDATKFAKTTELQTRLIILDIPAGNVYDGDSSAFYWQPLENE